MDGPEKGAPPSKFWLSSLLHTSDAFLGLLRMSIAYFGIYSNEETLRALKFLIRRIYLNIYIKGG